MSPRLLILAAAAASLASAASAQVAPGTATAQATFRGAAPAACQLSTPSSPVAENAVVGGLAPGSAEIALSQLIGDDGAPQGATIVLVLPAVCNQAHTLNLSSLHGGLLGDGPVTGGPFRSNLPYAVTVAWAGNLRSFASQDGALALALGDAAAGPVTVTIQIPPGGPPLAAGAYADELVLALGVAG